LDARARAGYGDVPLDPLAAMHAVASGLPADAVVIEEAITAGLLLRQVLRQDRPRSYVHTIGGGLGWGIGAAIGTRLGAPDRPVVAVLGDGSATFGLQGLWTAARHRVAVAFVVVNNGEYRTLKETLDRGKSRSTQSATTGRLTATSNDHAPLAAGNQGRYLGLDLRDPALDWTAAGTTFGIPVARPGSTAELADLVATVPDLAGPLLIEAQVTAHDG
jgi:benzoylformate decarboxylase